MLFYFFACAAPRDPAPEDLEGLTRYLYTHWEEPDLVSEGMTNMAVWLAGEGQTDKAQNEGYVLAPLDAEVLGDIVYPTRTPLDQMAGASITRNSVYSIDQHASVMIEEDQRWHAPNKYERYEREIVQGDGEEFISSGAYEIPSVIHTDNDTIQERLGVRIPYVLKKNYRWTTTASGQRAIVARSWIEKYGCSDEDGEGGNCLELSFSVDLFHENEDGTTTRMTASWNYLSLILELPFDFQIEQLANGIIAVDEATDLHLEETYGAP